MKTSKVVAFFVGILLISAGMCGFVMCVGVSVNSRHSTLEAPIAINSINGIAVDAAGLIHIADNQSGSVQTFDDSGRFRYGYTFPIGGGSFAFGMDSNDIVCVYGYRTKSFLCYKDGKLLSEHSRDSRERYEALEGAGRINRGRSFSRDGTVYTVGHFHRLSISKKCGDTDIAILEAPYWPLPAFVYWGIAAVGLGLWFYSFAWEALMQVNTRARK